MLLIISGCYASNGKTVLVVSTVFNSNIGIPEIRSNCEEICIVNNLWDNLTINVNDYLLDNSYNTLKLDKSSFLFFPIIMDIYATTLGCDLNGYADRIYTNLANRNIDVGQYDFQIILLPTGAGGGSCGSFTHWVSTACSGQGIRCPIFIRSSNPVNWMRMIVKSIGGLINNDSSDGINGNWMLLNMYNRYALQMVPNNVTYTLLTKSTESTTINIMSSSLPLDSSKNKTILVIYKNTLFVSLRTCTDITYDRFLPDDLCGKIYVHNQKGDVVGKLSIGDTYTNYLVDFVVRVIDVSLDSSILKFDFCNYQPLQPTLLNTSLVLNSANYVYPLVLEVGNPSAYCAPVTQTFTLGNITTLKDTCNDIRILIVPDLNPLEQSYDMTSENKNIVLKGDYLGNRIIFCGRYGERMTASFYDAGGDGYCCEYGGGSFYQVFINDISVKIGGVFTFVDRFSFFNKFFWYVNDLPSGKTQNYTVNLHVSTKNQLTNIAHALSLNTSFPTPSITQSISCSQTNSKTPSPIITHSSSTSPTETITISNTPISTHTRTNTKTNTRTNTRTNTTTNTKTNTKTATGSSSYTISNTQTNTKSYNKLFSNSESLTKSLTRSLTKSATRSLTKSFTGSFSKSATRSFSKSVTRSFSKSVTRSFSKSATRSFSKSATRSFSKSATRSFSKSATRSFSKSATRSFSKSLSKSVTRSMS
jgi:hypothetical protein